MAEERAKQATPEEREAARRAHVEERAKAPERFASRTGTPLDPIGPAPAGWPQWQIADEIEASIVATGRGVCRPCSVELCVHTVCKVAGCKCTLGSEAAP